MTGRLLVIDDDEASCRLVRATFRAEGVDVLVAHDGLTGLERAAAERPDLVLLDVEMPGLDGLEVLERIKSAQPALPVVMLTASHEVKTAVRATQLGAFDYLTKPIDHEEVVVVVGRALETRALRVEVEDLRQRIGRREADTLVQQMGPGDRIREVVEQVALVAASDYTVLVLGETGTGKELVAQAIHRQSERRRKPFIALDCGAIPEALLESELFGHERGAFTGADRRKTGRFQLADEGTCFLDEIGNLPISLQAKLLRALESKRVQPVGAERTTEMDVRFVAATNSDLQATTTSGQFRADLYFRLTQYTITLPPLRERREDIPHLTRRFLEEACVELRRPMQELVPAAMELLQRHDWPGNVRQLRNVLRQVVLQTKGLAISPVHLRAALKDTGAASPVAQRRADGQSLKAIADQAARTAERDAICETLRQTKGNKSQAAKALRTDYKTLHLKIRNLGICARDFSA